MSKTKTLARCDSCGHTEPRWMGRCPRCEAWGTMTEHAMSAGSRRSGNGLASAASARPIAEVLANAEQRRATGIAELDRVLGGGLVPGSVTLFGGEPGAGKSTLLLQAAHALAAGRPPRAHAQNGHGHHPSGATVLYVSAEESPGQVRLRADRLGALAPGLLLAAAAEIPGIVALLDEHDPAVLILDSIQTVRDPDTPGAAGGVGQVRACASLLVAEAKRRDLACVLVGHVTKDGQLAGPRVLEHVVDTVCDLAGERHHALRLLRATKNRFGPVGEVGCFEMTGAGLAPIEEAGRLFLGDAPAGTPGIAVTLTLEGRRPLACELQALVSATTVLGNPRRVASGLDGSRLHLLAAVLERRAGVRLSDRDLYASSVGGVRIAEPATDLALCLAIASSARDLPVSRDLVALAEVGLAGELRMVAQTERRLAEAARLGFRGALLPHAYDGDAFGLEVKRAPDLPGALGLAM